MFEQSPRCSNSMRISIDGNIGASKSTVLARLADEYGDRDIEYFPEPLDEWGKLLELFYDDPKTYALALSLQVLVGLNASSTTSKHAIVERSPLSCRDVFTQMLVDEGTMTADQFEVFNGYYDAMAWVPDMILFIDTPAAECMSRIESRARLCECEIDLQFLRRLEFKYDALLREHAGRVIKIDGTGTHEEVYGRVKIALEKILSV